MDVVLKPAIALAGAQEHGDYHHNPCGHQLWFHVFRVPRSKSGVGAHPLAVSCMLLGLLDEDAYVLSLCRYLLMPNFVCLGQNSVIDSARLA